MKERFKEIDLMRGIAMLAVMLNHTVVYFPSSNIANFLANASQFSVQVLLFCSAFIFWEKYKHDYPNVLTYVKKRFFRLLLPYYIFLFFWFILVFYFDPKTITTSYILNNILMIDGVAINWLVLLFLIFAFLLPVIAYFHTKQRVLFYSYLALSIFSTILFLFVSFPFPYQLINWLPWSLVLIFTYVFVVNRNNKRMQITLFISSILTIFVSYCLLALNHKSLLFYDNKYPPNLYLLSFGFLSISVLYWIFRKFSLGKVVESMLSFFSFYSFEVYFIHFFLIYLFAKTILYKFQFNWFTFFATIIIITSLIQLVYLRIKKLI